MNIQGKWKGEYTDQFGLQVPFELVIEENSDGFIGVCYDLYEKPVKSDIKGFVEDDLISFVKDYDKAIIYEEDWTIFEDDSVYHPGVTYYGRYNPAEDCFEGGWEIELDSIESAPDEYEIEFDNGTWKMEKM